jgi:hypothetical protein
LWCEKGKLCCGSHGDRERSCDVIHGMSTANSEYIEERERS